MKETLADLAVTAELQMNKLIKEIAVKIMYAVERCPGLLGLITSFSLRAEVKI